MGDALGIRRGWAAVFAVFALMCVLGTGPYLMLFGRINAYQIVCVSADFLSLLGLGRFVLRKPVASGWLRLLYGVLAVFLFARVIFMARAVGGNLYPWLGEREQWVSIGILAGVPIGLAVGWALWQYAMAPAAARQPANPPAP